MNMKKRVISLLMAIWTIGSCFLFSCDKEAVKTSQESAPPPTETEDTSRIYDAPVRDLGGHEFRF